MVVANPFVHDSRVLKEAGTLLARGWDVTVVAAAEGDLPRREDQDGLRVVRVPREPLASQAAKALLALRVRGAGSAPPAALPPAADVAGPELTVRRALEALTHLRFWRRAAVAAVRARPDVVVGHDLDALPAARAAATLRRIPLVYDSHELWLEMPPVLPRTPRSRRRWAAAERRLARSAALVVTVGDAIADELARRYGIARPLVLRNVPAPAAAPQERADRLRARAEVPADAPLVLYLGGLQAGRGLEELARAIGEVPDAVLVLLGPGDPAYGRALQAIGPAGRIRVLGAVPSAAVGPLAAEADVGVVPYRNLSMNHYLALPTKLFEYLGAGVPVVAPDFPEIRRVVHDHGAGVTCDTDDPAAVAAAIREVLARGEALRAAARRAGERLTWDREAQPYADALDRLVDG